MKKQTKLEKRRKTVLGAVLGFGAVALLTTATATWIIAVNNLHANSDVAVTVDTVKNNSVSLTLGTDTTGMTLKLGEEEEITSTSNANAVVTTEGLASFGAKFEITLPTVTLEYGSEWLAENETPVLNISISYKDGANANNLALSSYTPSDGASSSNAEGGADLINKRQQIDTTYENGGSNYWEYITLETTRIELVKGNQSNGIFTSTNVGKTVTFDWGSYFDSNSPATFYNNLFTNGDEGGKDKITVSQASNIEKELTKLADLKSLTITLSVDKESA